MCNSSGERCAASAVNRVLTNTVLPRPDWPSTTVGSAASRVSRRCSARYGLSIKPMSTRSGRGFFQSTGVQSGFSSALSSHCLSVGLTVSLRPGSSARSVLR